MEPIPLKSVSDSLPPNEKLVKWLRRMLKEAEEGKLRSFAGAGNYNNCDIFRMGVIDSKMNVPYFAIIGALHSLMLTIDKEYGSSDEITTK